MYLFECEACTIHECSRIENYWGIPTSSHWDSVTLVYSKSWDLGDFGFAVFDQSD